MATKSLTEKYTEQLRQEILAGEWNDPDSYITEKQLQEYFSISRVTVRRILANLQDENILKSIPSRGYVLGPAALMNQRANGSGSAVKADQILFVRSPNSQPLRLSDHERVIWEAACEEAERLDLKIELCRLPLKLLINDLKTRFRNKIHGVVLEWYERDVADALLKLGVPTVMVEYVHEDIEIDSVVQDNEWGMEQAVDLLWQSGHKNIGLAVWGEPVYQPIRRQTGFISSLLKRGSLNPGCIGTTQRFDNEGGREIVRKLFLNTENPPTALIISHLEMAAGIFEELESCNLKPGKDVALVVWGTPLMKDEFLRGTAWENLDFPLVVWPRKEMGKLIVRTLEARYKNPLLPQIRVKIETKITPLIGEKGENA